MKRGFGILLLLLVFNLDGTARAKGFKINSVSSPDGVAVVKQRRRRRRQRRHTRRRPTIDRTSDKGTGDEGGGGNTGSAPEPAPAPDASMTPPVGSSPDAPGRGRPAKRSAPRIKPPTVQIKPPTR